MRIKKHVIAIMLSVSIVAGSLLPINTGVEAAVKDPGTGISEVSDTVVLAATKSGWVKSDGKWYYYSKGKKVTGWEKISGKWYYFGKNGVRQNGWRNFSGKKYYFGGDGIMRTGWQKISGKWYYFGDDGVMRTGWKTISGKKYYFGSDGYRRTGWKKISGKWYFFKWDGGAYDSSKDGKISNSFPVTITINKLTVGSIWYGQENYYYFHKNGNYPSGQDILKFGSGNTISGNYAGKNGNGCKYTGKFTSVMLVDGYYKSQNDYKLLISMKLTDFKKVYSNGSRYYNSEYNKYVTAADHPVLQKGKTYYLYLEHRPAFSDGMGGGCYAELLDSNKLYTSYCLAAGSY